MTFYLSAAVLLLSLALARTQTVPLFNAAQPGQVMPWIGLGTGAYSPKNEGDNGKAYPECFMEIAGCGNFTIQAVKDWLTAAQAASPSPSLIRLDAADSYDTQTSVGIAMRESGLPRSSIFVLQKTGNCAFLPAPNCAAHPALPPTSRPSRREPHGLRRHALPV